jgi:hypothetical protein
LLALAAVAMTVCPAVRSAGGSNFMHTNEACGLPGKSGTVHGNPSSYCVYRDKRGCWGWYLMHSGRRIAESAATFSTVADCLADVERVKTSANAPVLQP